MLEGTGFVEVIEYDYAATAQSRCFSEALGADKGCEESGKGVVPVEIVVADVEMLLKLAYKEYSGGIRLNLFKGCRAASKGLFHAAFAVDGFLYAKTVGHLTEHDVPEEGVGGKVLGGFSIQETFARGFDNAVVLGADNVLKQYGTGSAVTLDIGVEGQVQGNDLDTGVCLSGIVKGVAGEDVRSCSGLEGLIFRITGKVFLQLPYKGHILHELVGLRQVLQQDVGLIGALDAKKLVVSDLVWTDDKVHLAVVHIQPGKCTLVIVVRLEGLDFFQEIFPHAGLDGDIGSNFQGILNLFDIGLVSVVIPYGFQGAVGGAADKCIWTVLVRIVPGFELLHRHVGRIETGSGRTVSIAFHE